MNVAVAISARADIDPASSRRNSDHGPVRSRIEGWLVASFVTEIAVRIDGAGHCTLVGGLLTGWVGGGGAGEKMPPLEGCRFGLAIVVPPTSILALAPGPLTTGGCTASATAGWLPPVWKNASRI